MITAPSPFPDVEAMEPERAAVRELAAHIYSAQAELALKVAKLFLPWELGGSTDLANARSCLRQRGSIAAAAAPFTCAGWPGSTAIRSAP